jgi:hypothetical protein
VTDREYGGNMYPQHNRGAQQLANTTQRKIIHCELYFDIPCSAT